MNHRIQWLVLGGLVAVVAAGCSPQQSGPTEATIAAPVIEPAPRHSRATPHSAIPKGASQEIAEAPAAPSKADAGVAPPDTPTSPEVESPPAISAVEIPGKLSAHESTSSERLPAAPDASEAGSEALHDTTGRENVPLPRETPARETSPPKTVTETPPQPPAGSEPATLSPPQLRPVPPLPETRPATEARPPHESQPKSEKRPRPAVRPTAAPRPRIRSVGSRPARLALIIDDVGMSTSQIAPFLDLDADLTYSIIPETRQAKRCLSLIESRGRLPMLHLPMEPLKRKDLLSPGGISVDLGSDEIERRVGRYLDELQGVRGVNNHMGSRATQDSRVMEGVLNVVKQRGLFFIDSKTVQQTVVSDVADRVGVPHASRDGEFLDDGGNTSRAYQIVLDLGREAQRSGSAIGIGHPHLGTARAIARALPELESMGVQIVPVSDLVHGGG